jgi:hypothetical protein
MEQFNCSAVDQRYRNILQTGHLQQNSSSIPLAPNGCEVTLNRILNRHPYCHVATSRRFSTQVNMFSSSL